MKRHEIGENQIIRRFVIPAFPQNYKDNTSKDCRTGETSGAQGMDDECIQSFVRET
jgi:hypothetical protein